MRFRAHQWPAAAALCLVVSACAAPQPPWAPASPFGETPRSAPIVVDDDGMPRPLAVRVCRPASARGALALAVINHGAPPHVEDAAIMQPAQCDSEPAQWFTAHGYVVVFALRRGFGASLGPIAEESGTCEDPDYVRAGREGARDIDAVVRWAEHLPGVRGDATVVVGQSTGGWAALAYAGSPGMRAVAVVNMAGGRGGRAFGEGGTYCHAERLVAAAGRFGETSRVPTLWVYSANDSYFTPELAAGMHAAFVASGGQATLARTPPFASEGHFLFYGAGGSAVWGPILMRFLNEIVRPPAPAA